MVNEKINKADGKDKPMKNPSNLIKLELICSRYSSRHGFSEDSSVHNGIHKFLFHDAWNGYNYWIARVSKKEMRNTARLLDHDFKSYYIGYRSTNAYMSLDQGSKYNDYLINGIAITEQLGNYPSIDMTLEKANISQAETLFKNLKIDYVWNSEIR